MDRWAEINLEFVNPRSMEDDFDKFIRSSKSFFEPDAHGLSLIVEFHGDDVCMWKGNPNDVLPCTMARGWKYKDLKKLVDLLHDHGFFVSHSVQANWYEYVPGVFALKHREIGVGFGRFYDLFAELRRDHRSYASFPSGIPGGVKFYEFFLKQWESLNSLIEFDYIFLRDGWLGKSWKRDSPIIYSHDERYEQMFSDFSNITKIITWSTGMSAHPFHSSIDLRRIMRYVDIFITQSYSNAWQTHWLKLNRMAMYGGHTPQITYAMVNQLLCKQAGIKHYVLIDAIDWEGWNSIHVNRDRARGMLWNLLLSAYEDEKINLPDGIWIGQAFDHRGRMLYTHDFEWIGREISRIERSRPKKFYGIGWKMRIENIERIAKSGIGHDPDGFQDEIAILLKWGVPISSIMSERRRICMGWNEDSDLTYGDASLCGLPYFRCNGKARISYHGSIVGNITLVGSAAVGEGDLIAELGEDKIRRFCESFEEIEIKQGKRRDGIFIPTPRWLIEKITRKYSVSEIPLRLLRVFGWLYYPLSDRIGSIFGFKVEPSMLEYAYMSNVRIGKTRRRKAKLNRIRVPLISQVGGKIFAKSLSLRDIPYKRGNILVERCEVHRVYCEEIRKHLSDIKVDSNGPITVKAFEGDGKVYLIVAAFDALKPVEFEIGIGGRPKSWGYFDEDHIKLRDILDPGNSRVYEIEIGDGSFPHVTHVDSPIIRCEYDRDTLVCEVWKRGGEMRISLMGRTEVYATEKVECKLEGDEAVVKIPRGEGSIGISVGRAPLESVCRRVIGCNDRKLAERLGVVHTKNPMGCDIAIWKGCLPKIPRSGAIVMHAPCGGVEYVKEELDDCTCNLDHRVMNYPYLSCLTHKASGFYRGCDGWEVVGGHEGKPTFILKDKVCLLSNYADEYCAEDYRFLGPNIKLLRNIIFWLSREQCRDPMRIL